MNTAKNWFGGLYLSLFLLLVACSDGERGPGDATTTLAEPNTMLVVASNYPVYYFASRIVMDTDTAIEVVFPDITGDPANWIPSVAQVRTLQSADLILINGAGAEPWLDLMSIDKRRLVDTSAALTDRFIPITEDAQHQHGPEGEHSHQGSAFTLWLDPQMAIGQVRAITDVLVKHAPNDAQRMRNNAATLERDLVALDEKLAAAFANLNGRAMIFSHPVYQYLQRRYDINGLAVHWEPDEEPGIPAWIELQRMLAKRPATIMIWEDEPLPAVVARLANTGIVSVVYQPAANWPVSGDFLTTMSGNVRRIADVAAN